MKTKNEIIMAVDEIYGWIDSKIKGHSANCNVCGKCCDFDSFDHKLFITTPELLYFTEKRDKEPFKTMQGGICPYNINQKCSVYCYRFAGCRIFSCKGDEDFQSQLTESVIQKFKAICENSDISYNYTDLATALNDTFKK